MIERQMLKSILENPGKYINDYLRLEKDVAVSRAVYKGKPVPFLYIPKLYMPEDINSFQEALRQMFEIINRSVYLYMNMPDIRRLFGFDERLDSLIRLPHYYDCNVPMGRFDLFYYAPGKFQFCELNTDGTSAMIEQKELADLLAGSRIMKDFSGAVSCTGFELFESWVNTVAGIYKQYAENTGIHEKSRAETLVAIVDFMDSASPVEFKEFARAFELKGFRCIIADPGEIKTAKGYMYHRDRKIDIVYRRLVTKDMMERYEEIPAFIEGLYAGRTCIIGSIKTQIVHTKKYFQVLHEPLFQKHLSPKQRLFIDRHIPFTQKLEEEHLQEAYSRDREDYIIKPVDYYASKGVYAGSSYSEPGWKELLRQSSRKDYIIQRYAPPSFMDNIIYSDKGGFEKKTFRTITGLFVYGEMLAGLYVRGGLSPIISGLHNGYTLGAFSARLRTVEA